MKPVLVLQHQTPENLAYLSTFLTRYNIPYVKFNAETDIEFPSSIDNYSALAVMGGAMSANDNLPTNKQAEILILQAMYRDKPVIGHCLGGQLMSKALGGKISKSYKPEIGWQRINYTDNNMVTDWFGTDKTDTVIHWHYETFSVPEGATLLASSNACNNQVFTIDNKHLAMQFHIEIDESKIDYWVSDTKDTHWQQCITEYDTVQDKTQILDGISKYIDKHKSTADVIYKRWLSFTDYKYKFV